MAGLFRWVTEPFLLQGERSMIMCIGWSRDETLNLGYLRGPFPTVDMSQRASFFLPSLTSVLMYVLGRFCHLLCLTLQTSFSTWRGPIFFLCRNGSWWKVSDNCWCWNAVCRTKFKEKTINAIMYALIVYYTVYFTILLIAIIFYSKH